MSKKKVASTALLITFLISYSASGVSSDTLVEKFANPPIRDPGQVTKVAIQLDADDLSGKGPADAVLTMDISRSMINEYTGIACTRGTNCKIDIAKRGFKEEIIDQVDFDYNKLGFVTFYGDPSSTAYGRVPNPAFITQVPLTGGAAAQALLNSNVDRVDRGPFQPAGTGIELGGCTSIGGGLNKALEELAANKRPGVPGFVILATDGLQNYQPSVYDLSILNNAISMGIKVYLIGIDVRHEVVADNAEFTFCRNNPIGSSPPGSGGDFIPSGNAAQPYNPTLASRLYNDQNACPGATIVTPTDTVCPNSFLDGEDYLIDITRKTGGNFYPTVNSGDFTNALRDILASITFDLEFTLQDVLNPAVFLPFDRSTAVKVYDGFNGTGCGGTDVTSSVTISAPDSPPVAAANINLGFKIDFGLVLKGERRCVEITAQVNPAFADPEDFYPIDIPDPGGIQNYLDPSLPGAPGVDLPQAPIIDKKIYIRQSVKPWVKVTGGTVGAQGEIIMERDPFQPVFPIPGNINTDFAAIAAGTNITRFESLKDWLIKDYGSIDLNGLGNYSQLHDKFDEPGICAALPGGLPRVRGKYEYTGDQTFSGTFSPGASCVAASAKPATVVFIKRSNPLVPVVLRINSNFNPGLPYIFIVDGNVLIDRTVTLINAMIIADGQIDTGTTGAAVSNDTNLVVNGGLVGGLLSSRVLLSRNLSTVTNQNTPGEQINFPAEYLYYFTDYVGQVRSSYKEENP